MNKSNWWAYNSIWIGGQWWLLRIRSSLRLQNLCINCWWGLTSDLNGNFYIVAILAHRCYPRKIIDFDFKPWIRITSTGFISTLLWKLLSDTLYRDYCTKYFIRKVQWDLISGVSINGEPLKVGKFSVIKLTIMS